MIGLNKQKVLIIAPHPDDEVFGCGGFINRVKREGGEVYVLYLTVGTTKDYSLKGISTKEERVEEIKQVAEFYNLDGFRIALPGNRYHLNLDAIPQKKLMDEIEHGKNISLEALKPTIVLSPPPDDYNQDHRAVANAVITATRPAATSFKSFQNFVLTYEFPPHVWSDRGINFSPNLFIELEKEDMEAKIKALEIYQSQLKDPANPLSVHGIKTLANMRGFQAGNQYSEAFFARRVLI